MHSMLLTSTLDKAGEMRSAGQNAHVTKEPKFTLRGNRHMDGHFVGATWRRHLFSIPLAGIAIKVTRGSTTEFTTSRSRDSA